MAALATGNDPPEDADNVGEFIRPAASTPEVCEELAVGFLMIVTGVVGALGWGGVFIRLWTPILND